MTDVAEVKSRLDQCLQRAAVRIQRQQTAVTIADEQSSVAGNVQAKRPAAGVGHNDRFAAVGWNSYDAAVFQPGPEPADGIDDDVLGSVARQRHDGDIRRREIG